MTANERPTDVEWAIAARVMHGVCPYGPLTLAEHEGIEAYERYCEESAAEYERLSAIPPVDGHDAVAENAECDRCGETKPILYDQTACTLGYPGHPGAEFTAFQICEECLR